MKHLSFALAAVSVLILSSCGYTSKTLLPDHVQTVHVEKVKNSINITESITSLKSFKAYRPGVEVELRNALIDRVVFDGHLKIAGKEKADAVLKAELLDFRRDPLRYNANDSIQEFRISVSASAQLIDSKTGKAIWQSPGMSGNSDYFLSGPTARSEDQAVALALEDLSRHIVEDLLEVW